VEKLVQSDLIERVEDPNDRRAKQLSLSRKGAQLVEQGIEERHRWMDDLALNISAEESAVVIDALEILVRAAGQLDEKI
jgi:DNA-binding MarR family transcriptional regulator